LQKKLYAQDVYALLIVLKFFLNISKEELKKRFLSRIDEAEKNWKFSVADYYQNAFEDMLNHTSTEHAPWFVIPADNKWFARLAVSEAVCTVLERLDLQFPKVGKDRKAELLEIKKALEEE
jgi:polyphosphate kinase 2 (PPK2 family)